MLLIRKNSLAKFVRAGDQARDARNWGVAVDNYAKAIEQDDSQPWLWVQYGHALKEHGQRSEAEQAYRKSIELEPVNGDTFLQLGHVLKVQGRIAEAATAYLNSVALDTSTIHARHELLALGWSATDIQQGAKNLFGDNDSGDLVADVQNAEGVALSSEVTAAPAGYAALNPDVVSLERMGLVQSVAQHYRLYGRSEGRDIVQSLRDVAARNAFVLCPSYGKRCGIGEHARYVLKSLESAGFKTAPVRSTRELAAIPRSEKQDGILIVNHGPGLFDGYNPELSEGEATSDLLSGLMSEFRANNLRPVIYMHSLLDRDNEVMFGRQKFAIDFPIPVITTISSAATHFHLPHVEHGVQPLEREYPTPVKTAAERDYPTIGFFGFFQWGGKDFDALINVARRLKASLVGSVATSSKHDENKLRDLLTEANVHCDLGTGWVTDDELARRLAPADFYYLPQKDYDHWNNSGTARFVANFGKPLLLPPHHPFLDLRDVAIFAEEHDLPAIVSYLREDSAYSAATKRIRTYADQTSMRTTVASIARELPRIYEEYGLNGFWSVNARSIQVLASLDFNHAEARLAHLGLTAKRSDEAVSVEELLNISKRSPELLPLRMQHVDEIEIWRKHYTLSELYQLNPQDFIVGVYRRLAKREPTFFEYRFARSALPTSWGKTDDTFASALLQFIGRVMINDLASDEPEGVEIYAGGKALRPAQLLKPSEQILENFRQQALFTGAQIARQINAESIDFSVGNTANLFSLLSLPAATLAMALKQVCRKHGLGIDFTGIGVCTTLRDRYMFVVDRFADHGAKIGEVFLLDDPIVDRIDYSRKTYCVSELVLCDGDGFITDMVRKLAKRNPHTVEFFHFGHIADAQGKFAALREFLSVNLLEAQVLDSAALNEDELAYPSISAPHFRRLINDFRSPVAGGWTARNRYLEDKRAFSRFWIRAKGHRDIWWIQSGANITALEV